MQADHNSVFCAWVDYFKKDLMMQANPTAPALEDEEELAAAIALSLEAEGAEHLNWQVEITCIIRYAQKFKLLLFRLFAGFKFSW